MSDRGNQDYSPAVRRATTVTFPSLIRSIMKRDWHGHEHIPRSGGVIVAANHLSYADWAAMALFIHQAGRYPAFLIKSSAFNVKVIGPFLHAAGQFPVNRGAADAALILHDAERGLAKGECLIFYPEGTATRDPDLWPMVPKTGAARLALATGAPVIPVAQWGTQDILPYGTKSLHVMPRHTVKMVAGPPVDLSGYEGEPMHRDVLRAASATIMADITGLLARLRGETPPAVPYDPAAARRASAVARRASRQVAQETMNNDPGGPDPEPAASRGPAPDARGGDAPGGEAPGGDASGGEAPGGDASGGDEPRRATPA
jgi:1-acyl-sn-glycerol-3-phosphate acyltransferase